MIIVSKVVKWTTIYMITCQSVKGQFHGILTRNAFKDLEAFY